jgi:hypothetical protein
MFIDMTQKTLGLYASANRLRSVVRLNFDMANLHYHRSRWEKAEPLLKAVSSTYHIKLNQIESQNDPTPRYGSDGWYALEYNARALLTECERRLGMVKRTPFVFYIFLCYASLTTVVIASTKCHINYNIY